MLREATGLARGVSAATTKIRKRCAASSSSSSDRHRQRRRWELRAKPSVRLIGRSVGAASHCPSRIKRKRSMSEPSWTNRRRRHGDAETRSAASARKLVSALWQQHGKGGDTGAFEEEDEEEHVEVGWDAAAQRRSSSDHRRSASVEVLSKLSRRKIKAFKEDDGERSWHNGHDHGNWFSDVMSNGGTVGGRTPARQDDRNRTTEMQELYNSLTASNELVRVLANVLGPTGGLTPTAASLLAALRSELDAARQLVKHQHRRRASGGGEEHDDDYERRLRRQVAEEARAWKHRHREKAAAAARLVASELDGERRARRRAERVGKKLAEALADAEAALRAAARELELERAARDRLEKVCDELARGVHGGGGGAGAEEEEELCRREAALEELEREREMLQVADELREERVRMKLAEARIHFEEKNAAVDRLRQELEAFLGTAGDDNERREETPVHHDQQLQLVLASEFGVDGIDRVVVTEKSGQEENAGAGADADDDDESDGSDDIELNMDGGNSWSYSNTSRSRETTATAAKNAASSAHGGGSVSDRATECGADAGAFDRRSVQDWAAAADGCSDDDGATAKDVDEDAERYEAIKNLREQMLAGHGAFLFLSTGEADADSDRQRHGFASNFEDGGLW